MFLITNNYKLFASITIGAVNSNSSLQSIPILISFLFESSSGNKGVWIYISLFFLFVKYYFFWNKLKHYFHMKSKHHLHHQALRHIV